MHLDWIHFTPLTSLLGGLLIGLAASIVVLGLGRIAGVSGVLAAAARPARGARGWQLAFCAGLLLSPWLWRIFCSLPPVALSTSPWRLIIAGLLVGYGVRLGRGCTSGHGVCGLARASPRSLLATTSFMLAGFGTVLISHHWLGWSQP